MQTSRTDHVGEQEAFPYQTSANSVGDIPKTLPVSDSRDYSGNQEEEEEEDVECEDSSPKDSEETSVQFKAPEQVKEDNPRVYKCIHVPPNLSVTVIKVTDKPKTSTDDSSAVIKKPSLSIIPKKCESVTIKRSSEVLKKKANRPKLLVLPELSITKIPTSRKIVKAPPTPTTPKTPQTPNPTPIFQLPADIAFIVEAPSFIAPYVYEKTPISSLKYYVRQFKKAIKREKVAKAKLNQSNGNNTPHEEAEKEACEEPDLDSGVVDCSGSSCSQSNDDSKDSGQSIDSNETYIDVESDDSSEESDEGIAIKSNKGRTSYFDTPLGKFFLEIGMDIVQEYVQEELLKIEKIKRDRDVENVDSDVNSNIQLLTRALSSSQEKNKHLHFDVKRCRLCSFRSESQLVMAHHMEYPHVVKPSFYRCNSCTESGSGTHIIKHMERVHNFMGRLHKESLLYRCSNCPFEVAQRAKFNRHLVSCAKRYKPDRNLEPPLDWTPPAKTLRVTSPKYSRYSTPMRLNAPKPITSPISVKKETPGSAVSSPSPVKPKSTPKSRSSKGQQGTSTPCQEEGQSLVTPSKKPPQKVSKARPTTAVSNNNNIVQTKLVLIQCEICDGCLNDLDQLGDHVQRIHKLTINPRILKARPPLTCQKCKQRFFTDVGLERHLMGSHGLLASSLQEAAIRGQDSGYCPFCRKEFSFRLLEHVCNHHGKVLSPAFLSYKCTICEESFGAYSMFEEHVNAVHDLRVKTTEKVPGSEPPTAIQ